MTVEKASTYRRPYACLERSHSFASVSCRKRHSREQVPLIDNQGAQQMPRRIIFTAVWDLASVGNEEKAGRQNRGEVDDRRISRHRLFQSLTREEPNISRQTPVADDHSQPLCDEKPKQRHESGTGGEALRSNTQNRSVTPEIRTDSLFFSPASID